MGDFIKLTRVTDWKVDAEKKKRTATGTMTVYIRPSEITQFSDDGDYTYVTLGDSSITVTEKADEIYKMVSEEKNEQTKLNDPYKVIQYPIYYEHTPSWWYAPWWTSPQITCNTATTISEGAVCACNTSDTADLLFRVTPNYASAIIVGNGEIWE
jgi:hypothetical protein